MALGINNNFASLRNTSYLNQTSQAQQTNFQRLSSGSQINSAKDNAAGLAIVERFSAQIRAAEQAYKNVYDGISLTQTAEGYTNQISDLTQRARELAVASGNGIYNDTDRAALQKEFGNIQKEVKRITESAEFNGQSLLNKDGSLSFQVDGDKNIDVKTFDLYSQLDSNSFFSADISTAEGAQKAIEGLDKSQEAVNTIRAEYGATINQFESAGRALQEKQVNLEESRSRIADADYAKEAAEQIKNQIKSQAGTAIHGQANYSNQAAINALTNAA